MIKAHCTYIVDKRNDHYQYVYSMVVLSEGEKHVIDWNGIFKNFQEFYRHLEEKAKTFFGANEDVIISAQCLKHNLL